LRVRFPGVAGRPAVLWNRMVPLVAVGITMVVVSAWVAVYSWGAHGELRMEGELDGSTIVLDGALNLTVRLKNVGATSLRVLPFTFGTLSVWLTNETGSVVPSIGPSPIFASPTSSDLVTLRAGESIGVRRPIDDASWNLSEPGYYLVNYRYDTREINLGLPHWRGMLNDSTGFEMVLA